MVDRSEDKSISAVRDMTPGTSFTGMHVDIGECASRPHRWFVFWSEDYGNAVVNDEGQRWSADSIDIASIWDVVEPTERGAAV